MILVSCWISLLSKGPKVILYAIFLLKQLDDLNIMVVLVQLEKGLKLNYILELHHYTTIMFSPPLR